MAVFTRVRIEEATRLPTLTLLQAVNSADQSPTLRQCQQHNADSAKRSIQIPSKCYTSDFENDTKRTNCTKSPRQLKGSFRSFRGFRLFVVNSFLVPDCPTSIRNQTRARLHFPRTIPPVLAFKTLEQCSRARFHLCACSLSILASESP